MRNCGRKHAPRQDVDEDAVAEDVFVEDVVLQCAWLDLSHETLVPGCGCGNGRHTLDAADVPKKDVVAVKDAVAKDVVVDLATKTQVSPQAHRPGGCGCQAHSYGGHWLQSMS